MTGYEKYSRLRDARGMTDYRVSIDTGINQSSLSSWKNGHYHPNVDKLIKIAKLFDVSVEDLVGDKSMVEEARRDERDHNQNGTTA